MERRDYIKQSYRRTPGKTEYVSFVQEVVRTEITGEVWESELILRGLEKLKLEADHSEEAENVDVVQEVVRNETSWKLWETELILLGLEKLKVEADHSEEAAAISKLINDLNNPKRIKID